MSNGLFGIFEWKHGNFTYKESEYMTFFQGIGFISPCYLYGGYSEYLHILEKCTNRSSKFKTSCQGTLTSMKT